MSLEGYLSAPLQTFSHLQRVCGPWPFLALSCDGLISPAAAVT